MDEHKILLYLKENNKEMPLFVQPELASTNDTARELGLQGCYAAVLADRQTAGRGRLGRSFCAESGGLYLSVAFAPQGPVGDRLWLTPLAGLLVRDLIEKHCAVSGQIKWPNDVLVRGKKVCGILAEAVHLAGRYFLVLGLGINLTNPLPEDLPQAANLLTLTGTAPEPERLAAEVIMGLQDLFHLTPQARAEAFVRYRAHCATIGQSVRVTAGSQTLSGTAVSVQDDGALLLRDEAGETHAVYTGEATLR